MNIPWSSFTKKQNYSLEKDRLQYKDLEENPLMELKGRYLVRARTR